MGRELERAGFKTEQGVDRLYLASARRSNRPVAALETAASQLQAFDNLPDPLEELLLQDSLARVDGFADEARGLIAEASGATEEAAITALHEVIDARETRRTEGRRTDPRTGVSVPSTEEPL